jgi:hypothetical protein
MEGLLLGFGYGIIGFYTLINTLITPRAHAQQGVKQSAQETPKSLREDVAILLNEQTFATDYYAKYITSGI